MIVVPGAAPERTFAGGLWSETMNVAWPLARLELSEWGIRFRASVRVLGWLIPRLDVPYEELTGAQLISAPVASHGVCLYTANATGPIVFLSRRGTDILDHLQVHGVRVDQSVTRLPWGSNLHHPVGLADVTSVLRYRTDNAVLRELIERLPHVVLSTE